MPSIRLLRSRRRFVFLGAVALVAPLLPNAAYAQLKPTASPMKIGIVGSGRLGGTVGSLLVKSGHEVMFSSRNPDSLKEMAAKLGPRASVGTVEQAIAHGNVILLAVPYSALPQIGRDHGAALAGKVIIDASNPIVRRDGEVAEEAMKNGIGPTSLKYLPGTRYVRAFNPVGTGELERQAERTGGTPIGMPLAGDDPQAVKIAAQLIRDVGLEPVTVPLSRAMAFAPGTPIFGRPQPVDELRKQLAP
jgi:8-hydroxy-5-deazaflavin:NADPH oxidoreductase